MMKTALISLLLMCFIVSCRKVDDWLDKKSNLSDITPTTLKDFQALLDYNTVMNEGYASMGHTSADNYFLPYTTWQSATSDIWRNLYTWQKEIYSGGVSFDWNNLFQKIEVANIVLEGLEKIEENPSNKTERNNIKGAALFYRSYCFFNLAQLFSKPFSNTASTDLGIPLRTTSDVNVKSVRSTLLQTYDKIIADLKEAEILLHDFASQQMSPSKLAARALLARVYLNMDNYTEALSYSTLVLNSYNNLIDYNTINPGNSSPMPQYPNNIEVIFYAKFSTNTFLFRNNLCVDTLLFNSYNINDLRKTIFYTNTGGDIIRYRGNYTGNLTHFGGITTNEIYLIRAECYARTGDISAALGDLNTLLQKRWKSGFFIPVTATDAEQALFIILDERRKELPFYANTRWEDLRRLNKDPRFTKTLKRILNGNVYELPPNDKRYVLPIPDDEIRMNGLEQNPR